MKKLKILLLVLTAVMALSLFTACNNDGGSIAPVVITANDKSFTCENKTLLDYMSYLQDNGKLSFTVKDGMVTSINGKSNTTNSYWMLYTSDTENANADWGKFDNNGEIYGSATLGAETLAVKENCVYVWAYETF